VCTCAIYACQTAWSPAAALHVDFFSSAAGEMVMVVMVVMVVMILQAAQRSHMHKAKSGQQLRAWWWPRLVL